MQIDPAVFPLPDRFTDDQFIAGGQIAGHAEPCPWLERFQQVVQQLVVPEWGFDENLGLFQALRLLFQLFQPADAGRAVNGKIAMKSKRLAVKPRSHQGQYDRTRPDERYHLYAEAVCMSDDVSPGIGNARAAGLTHQSGVPTFQQSPEKVADICFIAVMFAVIMYN